MGHGAGHVVYKIANAKGLSIREASERLAKGEFWEDAVNAFRKGDK